MVSFVSRSDGVHKRRRTSAASLPTDALTPVQLRQTARCRKQTLTAKLSDSGFEEDLGPSPCSSSGLTTPLRSEELPTWYLQYGDVGYLSQREREAHFHPCKSLARQPQLTAEARCTLVSWLIPVHRHFRLSFECCCLSVNIMDRFLACTPVAADCFQLVGVTALLLATKLVEVCSPRISHLLSICCDAFTKEQLCNLECLILVRLNFRLAAPTLAFFLDYYTNRIKAAELVSVNTGFEGHSGKRPGTTAARHCTELAQKVCELSLADYAFNRYPPSLIASCALWLACDLLKTKQGLVEHAALQSQEDQWSSFVDELCVQPASGASSLGDSLVPVSLGSCNHSLAQECKENLKLLVSLNEEAVISTMESLPF